MSPAVTIRTQVRDAAEVRAAWSGWDGRAGLSIDGRWHFQDGRRGIPLLAIFVTQAGIPVSSKDT